MIDRDLAERLHETPLSEIIEFIAHEMTLTVATEVVLEFVVEDGNYRRGWIRVGPASAGGLERPREVLRAWNTREEKDRVRALAAAELRAKNHATWVSLYGKSGLDERPEDDEPPA